MFLRRNVVSVSYVPTPALYIVGLSLADFLDELTILDETLTILDETLTILDEKCTPQSCCSRNILNCPFTETCSSALSSHLPVTYKYIFGSSLPNLDVGHPIAL
jgi:hypothetical protein